MPGPITTVKAGAIRIPIYWHAKRNAYRAQWTDHHGRHEVQSVDLEKVRAKVRKRASSISRNDLDLSGLTPEQEHAIRLVLQRGLTASDLDSVSVSPILLSDASTQFLSSKADASNNHRITLRTHLRQLDRAFPGRPIATITTLELDAYLSRIPGARTRRNKRGTIVSLWRWARAKGYLPQEALTAAERTDAPSLKAERRSHSIATYSPDELATILAHVPPAYLPWVLLSAFAGLRTYEIFADEKFVANRKPVLAWEDVDLASGRILVPAAVSKTADRRAVPICASLSKWLLTCPRPSGPVCPCPPPWVRRKSLKGKSVHDLLGVPWRRNALRHSFGTYRVLAHHSLSDVALEMGNSERMIRNHYLDVGRTKDDAERWFALGPDCVDRSIRVA